MDVFETGDLFSQENPDFSNARFDGPSYKPAFDDERLRGQMKKIFACMKDGKFRTLGEIEAETGAPQPSISAQLRHLRKDRFGCHTINKQSRGDRDRGLFEYQLVVNIPYLVKFGDI